MASRSRPHPQAGRHLDGAHHLGVHGAQRHKTLDELIDGVYAIVGPFSYDRDDLHISEALKQEVLEEKCRSNAFDRFGDLEVRSVETIDGFQVPLRRRAV
ncbi:MAG: hypothetical protein R2810_04040 [Flavobacteriales bacterium]